jgi:hypothetical protein
MDQIAGVNGFIVYDNRSGSTLLASLLNRYRGVAVTVETDVVFQVLEARGFRGRPADVDRLLAFLVQETRFAELDIEPGRVRDRLAFRSEPTKGDVVGAVLDEYFGRHDPGALFRIVKGPRLQFHLERLATHFPNAGVIHMVRDPRAVFASKRQAETRRGTKMDENPVHAGITWRRKMTLVRKGPARVLTIRFEDLVAAPEGELTRALDFLGVPAELRVETKSQAQYAALIPPVDASLHQRVARPPDAARATEWVRLLGGAETRALEILAGRELLAAGYRPQQDLDASVLETCGVLAGGWLRMSTAALARVFRAGLDPRARMLFRRKLTEYGW